MRVILKCFMCFETVRGLNNKVNVQIIKIRCLRNNSIFLKKGRVGHHTPVFLLLPRNLYGLSMSLYHIVTISPPPHSSVPARRLRSGSPAITVRDTSTTQLQKQCAPTDCKMNFIIIRVVTTLCSSPYQSNASQ